MGVAFNKQTVDAILEKHEKKREALIAILQDIQQEYRYLSEEAMEYVAQQTNMSEAKVYSVATFYENFSLDPKGEYVIKICDGTACHVRKSIPILEAIRKKLSLSEQKCTTDDLQFTVETVSCLGACGLAPVITINDKVYGSMTPEKAIQLIDDIKEGK